MNKLLAVVLSITLFVSSVTPSFAQAVSAGRQVVKGMVQSGAKSAGTTAGKQALATMAKEAAAAGAVNAFSSSLRLPAAPVRPAAKPSSLSTPQLRLAVDRSIQQQLALTGNDIRAFVKAGQTEGMASRILSHENPAFREGLLRNEFVTVALKGGATAEQISQAVQFYRRDLNKYAASFAQIPQTDLASVLKVVRNNKDASYTAVLNSHRALSSAAALGLLGSKADATVLLDFYKQASQSVFKDTAAVIAARGLLRQGAYKELESLALLTGAQGPFWQDLAALVQEKGLSVTIEPKAASAVAAQPAELSLFLRAGCEPNALNADLSRQATEKWLAFSTEKRLGAAAAQQPQLAEPAALKVELPKLIVPEADLNLDPIHLNGGSAAPAAQAVQPAQTQLQQKTVQFFAKSTPASAGSGTLYSGLPVLGMGNMFKKAAAWLRGKWGKKEVKAQPENAVKEEEPGLHDSSEIQEVFSNLRSPESPAAADELIGANETGLVPVSEKGFKLTLVDGSGVERILPVNLEISNRFHVKGYNRIAFAAHSNFKHGYVAELRNQEQEPLRMAHFYMRLQSNQVGALADLIRNTGIEKFSLKLENNPNVAYKSVKLPAYDFVTGKELPLEVELPVKSYPEGAKVVVMENGALGILKPGAIKPYELNGFYVRLPKNQISNFVEVLRYSPTSFNFVLHIKLNAK